MRTLFFLILSVTLLAGFSGCSSMGKMPNPFTGVKQEARRSVAVWSPAARVVNGVSERGFAARVTFFGNDPKKGVKVDGDIVVYAFDEYPNRSAGNTKPDKSYPFLAEDLKHLQSYSKKLGYSYSLWVPWDNAGPDGERKTVSLNVKCVPKNGSPFNSGQAKCVLPGKEPVFFADHSRQEGPITQVHYQYGRADRFDDHLPPGFRDWTKQETTPDERQIRVTNRPTQMVKTTIPIPNQTYSAIMQNNPAVNPLEWIAAQQQPYQQPSQQPVISQYVPEPNPVTAASYNAHPHNGQAPVPPQSYGPQQVPQDAPAYPNIGPSPTDVEPQFNQLPPSQNQGRVEQQGNATVTYFNESPQTFGYGGGTNPLSRSYL